MLIEAECPAFLQRALARIHWMLSQIRICLSNHGLPINHKFGSVVHLFTAWIGQKERFGDRIPVNMPRKMVSSISHRIPASKVFRWSGINFCSCAAKFLGVYQGGALPIYFSMCTSSWYQKLREKDLLWERVCAGTNRPQKITDTPAVDLRNISTRYPHPAWSTYLVNNHPNPVGDPFYISSPVATPGRFARPYRPNSSHSQPANQP
jgi:hypothetical protein